MHYGTEPSGRETHRILYCRHCGWRTGAMPLGEQPAAYRHGHPDTCEHNSLWFVDFEHPAETEMALDIIKRDAVRSPEHKG